MAAELAVLEVLLDDTFEYYFVEEEDDDLPMFSMAAIIARRSLNRCQGYFEQTVPLYSVDEFQSHFRLKRTTFEILVREAVGTGVLPIGNVFGRQVIDARKQVSIFLWFIANQESTRLVADRFNVTFSSVSRVVRRVMESVLALRNQYIKWPNETQLRETMESFRAQGGFPGVVGVIDGSLVKIRAPVENAESYICRKKYHALQLQVIQLFYVTEQVFRGYIYSL